MEKQTKRTTSRNYNKRGEVIEKTAKKECA